MNEFLIALASELNHINEHLAHHEEKIQEIANAPLLRIQQITTAIISALAGGLIPTIIAIIFN